MDDDYQIINQQYLKSAGDSTSLFRVILSVAERIGMDAALACLEQCVTAKRLAWLKNHPDIIDTGNDPVSEAYRLFYEVYLGVSIPGDGEIVEKTDHKMVTRWWNHCPTLDACMQLGLDTREICQKVYHQPVQAFMSKIHPDLRFDRNYACLRPHTDFCEEIISLADEQTHAKGEPGETNPA